MSGINTEIGWKIKQIRQNLGMSQMKLAEKIGVSFQQVQKYESGVNKISVERLLQIATVLGVPINSFLGEWEDGKTKAEELKEAVTHSGLKNQPLPIYTKDEKTLLKLFRNIMDERVKKSILLQLKAVYGIEKRAGRG